MDRETHSDSRGRLIANAKLVWGSPGKGKPMPIHSEDVFERTAWGENEVVIGNEMHNCSEARQTTSRHLAFSCMRWLLFPQLCQ